MAASRNLLLTIIDAAPIRVFWKDRDLRYLGCNRAFAADAGMTHPRDVVGKDDYQIGRAAQAERYRADDRAVMASGVAKLTFYRQFASKDDLVRAFLDYRHERWMAWFVALPSFPTTNPKPCPVARPCGCARPKCHSKGRIT